MPLSQQVQEYCRRLRQNDPSLTEIILILKGNGDEGALALAQALPNNTFLKKLSLGVNGITDVGPSGFANALKINKTLQELNLGVNQTTVKGATNLANSLKTNKTLQVLSLYGNQISDEGAADLAEALKTNKTLQELHLQGNQITDVGATDLAQALKTNFANALKINKTLQVLRLNNNQIADKGATELAEALKINTKLQTLGLGYNGITNKGATALLEALQEHNGTLTFLDLDGNPNISNTITQQINALAEQNENGTRNPVPQPLLPLPAPIVFRNALEQIRLLVAKTPNGQAVSIVPLLQHAVAHHMSDFWQLKYLYTAVNVYYKLGAISAADRTTLIQDMLETAKEWCRTPFETAVYRMTLKHAHQQGVINDLQQAVFEEEGRQVQISNADFICHIRQLIQQNTDRLDRVEHIQQAMCDAMVRLQNHVQELTVVVNQVQDNVERVATSYSNFIASYQYKKRIEAGCDVLAAIMNICSFGAAGNVFKGVVGYALGSVVDLSDLQHIHSVVSKIQTSVVVVEENGGIGSGHDNSDCSDGLTVLESFEKGLELAKENLADRKLEEAISKKNAVVLLSASVSVFSQAWEFEDNDDHQEQQEPSTSTLDTTTTSPSGGQEGPSSSSLQQEPQHSTAETTATTQEATAAPAAFLSVIERVERLETNLGVPASESNGKNMMQRIGICEVHFGATPTEGPLAVKLLHLEREMGLGA